MGHGLAVTVLDVKHSYPLVTLQGVATFTSTLLKMKCYDSTSRCYFLTEAVKI